MSDEADSPREERPRPSDPAGTQPKVDPETLLPRRPLQPPATPGDVVEGEAVEEPAGELGEGEPAGPGAGDLLPERRAAAGVAAVAGPPPPPPHQSRFHFVYGALAALAAAAVAALVVVLATGGGGSASGANWSPWHPSKSDVAGANEIAGHVAHNYRSGGRQLVAVQASGMDFEGIPLTVAIRQTPAQGGNIRFFDGGFIFRLCGLGPQCSIPGQKSTDRHLLLRREALELALYSFRYLNTDQVVVLMPPPPGEQPSQAVFFRHDDVAPELHRPLYRSLAPRTPSVQTIRLSPDSGLVDRLTINRLFNFSLTQANTANRGFLVLDPVTPAAAAADPPAGNGQQTQSQQSQQKPDVASSTKKSGG